MYSRRSIKEIDAIPLTRLFRDAESRGDKSYCRCPECGAEGKKKGSRQGLQITARPGKPDTAKCWQCGFYLSGAINAFAYLKRLDSHTEFIKVVEGLSDETGFHLEKEERQDETEKDFFQNPTDRYSFAFSQLEASGLQVEDTAAFAKINGVRTKVYPFQKGSMDVMSGKTTEHDDDMLIAYFDLEGNRKMYAPNDRRRKEQEYTRVRWKDPEGHADKSGKARKYSSPKGSKAEFYIPQRIRSAYQNAQAIETLFIQEGEKKAEKACKHGIPSIGIQGINNIGNKEAGLPGELRMIVERCSVKNIVLMFDSDWDDLSSTIQTEDDVDKRPKQFAGAAIKFRNYIKTLHQHRLFVDVWFGHILHNELGEKGIDDILAGSLKGTEQLLKEDIDTAMLAHDGKGALVSVHNISTKSEYQIQDFWNLNSAELFFERHREKLLPLKTFRFGRILYVVEGEEIVKSSEFGSSGEFWEVYFEDDKKKIKLRHLRAIEFLQSNGYYVFRFQDGSTAFVHLDHGVIRKNEHDEILRMMFEYALKTTRDKEIHEHIAANIHSKFNRSNLLLLRQLETDAGNPEETCQRFYFEDTELKVTDTDIETNPITGPVWEDNLIKRPFRRIRIFEEISKTPDGKFIIKATPEGDRCEFLKYLINTSTFLETPDEESDYSDNRENAVPDYRHLINKITCIGYLLRDYKVYSESKAIVAMDARISEVGDSNGRSGKSLIGLAISKMIKQQAISGKKTDVSDPFLLSEVRESTKNIFIDDIKINSKIEDIYPEITGDMTINVKTGGRFTIPFEKSPKFYITTNHALNEEGDSSKARVAYMAFSTWYNIDWTPNMEFGHDFFSQWDDEQWNLFDNFMAECVMIYMRSLANQWSGRPGGIIDPPLDEISHRQARQTMGEAFFQWAEAYFAPGAGHLNEREVRKDMFDKFHREYPGNMRFVTANKFRKKVIAFCSYKGLHLNAHRPEIKTGMSFKEWTALNPGSPFIGKEDKSNGKEFYTITENNEI